MKLLYTGNSPYARRARIAVREAGLLARTEECDITPREENLDQLLAHGAAGKVPVLVTDAGVGLCESLVITNYLDRISGGKLYPSDPAALEVTLEIEGLASALMDATFTRSRENRRESSERSPSVFPFEGERAGRIYDALETRLEALGDRVDAAAVCLVASLGYADWRAPGDAWRDGRPRLTAWFESMSQRPAMAGTAPVF